MPNLPSGPGPTTKDRSMSVTTATDDPGNIAEQNIDADLDAVKTSLASLDGKTRDWSLVFTTALASKLIARATPGRLRVASGRIDSTAPTAVYYVHCWNLADVPANATAVSSSNALMAPFKVNHVLGFDDYLTFEFSAPGAAATVGGTFGLSTTEFTQTAAGAFLSLTAEVAAP